MGRAIVERLVAEGRDVTALARSEGSAGELAAIGARPARGDVLEPEGLRAAMAGSEVVYHVAGANAFCLADPTPLFRVNVEGSLNVVSAAAEAGVSRLVYTSSAAALGEARGTVGSESSPHRGWFLSSYERSKFEAERAVVAEAARSGLDVVSVNPASVQGPGRTRGTAKLLLDYLNGRLKFLLDARMSLVDVADCTEGHLLAEARGTPGERYVLSGAATSVREAIDLLARVTGIERRTRTLPARVAVAGGAAVEAVARLRRHHPPVCRELVRTLIHGHSYDGSKATRELGLAYTPLEETIRRTVAWYRERGLVE